MEKISFQSGAFCCYFQRSPVAMRVFDWTLIYQSYDQKVTQTGGCMLSLFTKQKTTRLLREMSGKPPLKGCITSAFIWLWHKRFFQSDAWVLSMPSRNLIHHPSWSHFQPFMFGIFKAEIVSGVNHFLWAICWSWSDPELILSLKGDTLEWTTQFHFRPFRTKHQPAR